MRSYQGGTSGSTGQTNASQIVQSSQWLKEWLRFVNLIAVMVVAWLPLKRGWVHKRKETLGAWKQGSHPCKPGSYSWSILFLSLVAALLFMLSPTCRRILCWSFLSSYRLIGFPQECCTIVPVCLGVCVCVCDNRTRDVIFQCHICQGCPWENQ